MQHDREEIASSLRAIRDEGGIDANVLSSHQPLLDLGYVLEEDVRDRVLGGFEVALGAIFKLIDSAHEKVGDRKRLPTATVADAALGYSKKYRGQNLMQRRSDVAMELNCGGDTVRKSMDSALSRVADFLLDYSSSPPDLDERLSESISDRIAAQHSREKPWIRAGQNTLVVLNNRGAVVELTQDISIKAKTDSLRAVTVIHEYIEDRNPGVIKAERALKCRILRQEDFNGAHRTELALEPPLQPKDEPREIQLRLSVKTNKRSAERIRASDVEAARATMQIQFDARTTPTVAWWWQQTGMGDEYEFVPEQELPIDDTGYTCHIFKNILASENYGIAWVWPQADEV